MLKDSCQQEKINLDFKEKLHKTLANNDEFIKGNTFFSLNKKLSALLTKGLFSFYQDLASESSKVDLAKFLTSKRFFDVATDHGQLILSFYLFFLEFLKNEAELGINSNFLPQFWASDCSAQCLTKAEKLSAIIYQQKQVLPSIVFRELDGLFAQQITKNDYVFVAGVGGDTLLNILSNEVEYQKGAKLFLHPTNSLPKVRYYLNKWNFCIEEEILVQENEQLYVILVVTVGKDFALREKNGEQVKNDLSTDYFWEQVKMETKEVKANIFWGKAQQRSYLFSDPARAESLYIKKTQKYIDGLLLNPTYKRILEGI